MDRLIMSGGSEVSEFRLYKWKIFGLKLKVQDSRREHVGGCFCFLSVFSRWT